MADCTSGPIKGISVTVRTMQEVHLQVSCLWTGHLESQWQEDHQCDTGPGAIPEISFRENSQHVTLEKMETLKQAGANYGPGDICSPLSLLIRDDEGLGLMLICSLQVGLHRIHLLN